MDPAKIPRNQIPRVYEAIVSRPNHEEVSERSAQSHGYAALKAGGDGTRTGANGATNGAGPTLGPHLKDVSGSTTGIVAHAVFEVELRHRGAMCEVLRAEKTVLLLPGGNGTLTTHLERHKHVPVMFSQCRK